MRNQQVVLITGCSSGIGLATAVYLAGKRCKVYASVRNLAKSDRLLIEAKKAGVSIEVLQLDVTDENSVKTAVSTIAEKERRIDALVNNAGYGSAGFLEDFSMQEIKAQFETNLFGLIRVTQEVLPLMRKQGEGRIVNISSIVGKIAYAPSPVYSATKFAVEAITESLRIQLTPFNISVSAIEPPWVRTNFLGAVKFPEQSLNPLSLSYEFVRRYQRMAREMLQNRFSSVEPLIVARAIHTAITSKNPKRSYLIGKTMRMFLILKSILPNRIFEPMLKRQFS